MTTRLYLTNQVSTLSLPTVSLYTRSPYATHSWEDNKVYVLSSAAGSSTVTPGGDYDVSPDPHYSRIRTYMSPAFTKSFTFGCNNNTISAVMAESNYDVYSYWEYDEDWHKVFYRTTYSVNTYPHNCMYIWRPSTNAVVGVLSNGWGMGVTGGGFYILNTGSTDLQKYLANPSVDVSVQSGDRLVLEVWHYQQTSLSGWLGVSPEHFYYNDGNSYIDINTDFGSLATPVAHGLGFKYGIGGKISKSLKSVYKVGYNRVSKSFKSVYYMYDYRYINLYLETASPARGRTSLKMSPRSTRSYNFAFTDYSQKWVLSSPSLHKFKMIDDFEGYDDTEDLGGVWTVSDGPVTFSAIKTFSGENFEDYNLLTFYANADQPSAIQMRFKDSNNNYSNDMNFVITDKWQRYETTVSWGGTDERHITAFEVVGSYSGYVTLDDIFLLDYENTKENVDWMKMNLTGIEFGREAKMNTFQIPFKQAEVIQFSGEKNGEGELRIRTIDSMQTEFLNEMMKTNAPLYFRYKNVGYPIALRDTERTINQVIPSQVSSDITIPFYEIYDYSMW